MRLHYSQSSNENATPSSGTSLLASCNGVPPRPPAPRRIMAEMCRITTHRDTQHQGAGCAQVEVPGHTRHPALLSDAVVNDTYKSKRSDLNNGM